MANMAHRAFEIDGVMTSGALGRGPDAVGLPWQTEHAVLLAEK